MKSIKLGSFTIFHMAFMYVGTIVGAGFSSGRELWQFFGIFGKEGFYGVVVAGLMFILVGYMTASLSRTLETEDVGRILSPFNGNLIGNIIEYSMATILILALVNMSSAAGAILNQEFGIHRSIGGIILVVVVVMTVIGGFERVSGAFQMIMPLLILSMLVVSTVVIIKDWDGTENLQTYYSPIATGWKSSAIMYFSYNVLSAIPIISSGSQKADNYKIATRGAMLGGFILFLLAMLLSLSMATDQQTSFDASMPMLALSKKIGLVFNVIYGAALVFAIYSSATGNFYGFRQRLKADKNRNKKLIFFGLVGFAFGLVEFKLVVAYMLPMVGIFGLFNFIFLVLNFIKVIILKKYPRDLQMDVK